MQKAVISLSGGLDSAVCLGMAVDEGYEPITVSFTYGQRHTVEVEKAKIISALYDAKHHIVDLPHIFGGSDSTLIASNELKMSEESYEDIDEAGGVSPTYVPYRNGNLLDRKSVV